MRRPGWIALGLWIGVGSTAGAGPLRSIGYDSASLGQAGPQVVYGEGLGVLFGNPANLLDLEPQISLGFVTFQPNLNIKLMSKPSASDVPITLYDSDVGIQGQNLDRPLPTAELRHARADARTNENQTFLGIGAVHGWGTQTFRLGALLWMPADRLISSQTAFADEREAAFSNTVHFARFGEWNRMLSLTLGAAYRPWQFLRIGLAGEVSLALTAGIHMFIPEATVQEYALINTDLDARLHLRGLLGITFQPQPAWRLSLVVRAPRVNEIKAQTLLTLWNYHESGDATVPRRVVQNHRLVLDYEPFEIALGGGLRWSAITAQASLTWSRWSAFLDNHHARPEETASYQPATPDDPKVDPGRFTFRDTWSGQLGLGWEYKTGLRANLGGAYSPSPVPAQVGRSNYADGNLWTLAAGHTFAFELSERSWEVVVGLQLWRMTQQTVYKDASLIKDEFPDRAVTLVGGQPMSEAQGLQTNNPGFPGYTSGGWALAGGLSLSTNW